MPAIDTAGIISKPRSAQAASILPELIVWLRGKGVGVRLDTESAAYAGLPGQALTRSQVPLGAQIVIVLGGDGTLLSAARAVGGSGTPIFAVNLGGLGFLTAITIEDLYLQLDKALRGELEMNRRRMLRCEVWRQGLRISTYEGLNDMVLAKSEIARMIDMEIYVDDHFVCVYKADGLIVSTPTGSTAYSLSAGGPIVYPTVAALAITPICPHMLTNRPVIVPDDSVIEVKVHEHSPIPYLTIDGQVGELLRQSDRLVCQRSEHSINLVQPAETMFFDVLREKLKWGDR